MPPATPPRSEAIAPVSASMHALFEELRIEEHPMDMIYWRMADDEMEFGTLADAFGEMAHGLEVGERRADGCKERGCTAWWPVTMAGHVVCELRLDRSGYGFTDPAPDVAGMRLS